MIAIYLFFVHLVRRIRIGLKEPAFRGLFYSAVLVVAFGGWFYHRVEGWSWIDSYYFTIITLTTIGYGDFAPQTVLGKIFTMLYVLIGLGIISSFILMLASLPREERPFPNSKHKQAKNQEGQP